MKIKWVKNEERLGRGGEIQTHWKQLLLAVLTKLFEVQVAFSPHTTWCFKSLN